jgi:hypothetical protein
MKMAVSTSKQRNSAARSDPQSPRTPNGSEFRHHAQASASSKASATRAIQGADLPPPTAPRQLNRGRSRRSELAERTYRSWPAVSQIWALEGAGGELDADGGLGHEAELVAREAGEQVGLVDIGVSAEHHLEEVVIVVLHPVPCRHCSGTLCSPIWFRLGRKRGEWWWGLGVRRVNGGEGEREMARWLLSYSWLGGVWRAVWRGGRSASRASPAAQAWGQK